jgi:hypothetical protein
MVKVASVSEAGPLGNLLDRGSRMPELTGYESEPSTLAESAEAYPNDLPKEHIEASAAESARGRGLRGGDPASWM